ncbi:MAG: acetate/propionate family kinase [Pseudomonadota bacterium]
MKKIYATLNAGSSSVKFSIFLDEGSLLKPVYKGEISHLDQQATPTFYVCDIEQNATQQEKWEDTSYEDALKKLIGWISTKLSHMTLCAIGHRVVHGGLFYDKPTIIDSQIIKNLKSLCPLAPLHQAHNLLAIEIISEQFPNLLQIACFDTAFHHNTPRLSRLYALPRELSETGIQRFGFHGLSYEFIIGELSKYEPRATTGKVIVAHLGNGASLCALSKGKSIASTMGFSALDGLPMGTRCGNIDPGILLYLLQEKQMSAKEIETLLYKQSGLLGISGISSDMSTLLNSADPHAQEAIQFFTYRIVREIGSLVAALGGLDALVFTAGIGEHSPLIREAVCHQSNWLPIELDEHANSKNQLQISTSSSAISVWVIPTNEELVIANYTSALSHLKMRI